MPAGTVITKKSVKRPQRGRSWYNKKYSVGDIAMKAWSAVKYMRTLINSERKLYTLQVAPAVQTYNGNVIQLTNIAQGDQQDQREGRSILINYLQLRGLFTKGTGNDVLRYMIVRDKYQAGTAPAVDQILTTIGTSLAPYAPLEPSFAGRFEVLDTGMVTFSPDKPTVLFKKFIRLNKHCKWQTVASGGGTMAGHIYFISLNNTATNGCTVEFVSRVGYRDN